MKKKQMTAVLLALLLLIAAVPSLGEGEDIVIDAVHSSDEYKALLMDAFDQTVLGANTNVRQQLKKILYLDSIEVDATAYNAIVSAVQRTLDTQSLSEGATLDSYTEQDLAVAVELINAVCDALDLDCSIDPSNDSQNEYARVITIKKNGKVLGKINSDAKTDVGERASVVWIAVGGALLLAALASGVWILTHRRENA
ncbi:MAG: hypothetical protein IJP98_01555 [Clostridia bacterium]|nr:hypothetical protein [Clostridia bacterium]